MRNIMKNLKNKKQPSSKLKTLLLSIFFAVALWFMVLYIDDPSIIVTINNIGIQYIGEEPLNEAGLALTGKNKIPAISVTVQGKRSDLVNYMNNVYATVDVSNIDEIGEYKIPVKIEIPSSRLTLRKSNTSSVTLMTEILNTKFVQVKEKQTGINKEYFIDTNLVDSFVELKGAKSELEKISYVVADVDITNITEKTTNEYSFSMYDASDNAIENNETVTAERNVVAMEHTPYRRTTLNVIPELSGEAADGYVLDLAKSVIIPQTVEVGITDEFTGTGVGLNIDRYTTKETEFYLKSADGLYIPRESIAVKVKPVFYQKTTKTLNLTVTAQNLAQGLTADFAQEITAYVTCAEDVSADQVKAEINLLGLGIGTHTVPVTISGDKVASSSTVIDVTIR